MQNSESTAMLLRQWKAGDTGSQESLIDRLYPEIAQIAAAKLRFERHASMSTGDLINDAVIRLLDADREGLTDRAHFIALASRMMRNILVDHARLRNASKRKHVKVELRTSIDGEQRFDLIQLETALIRLGVIDAQLMEVVEMRYYGGMTVADIAVVTGLSEPTVKRRWQTARAWLADAIGSAVDDG